MKCTKKIPFSLPNAAPRRVLTKRIMGSSDENAKSRRAVRMWDFQGQAIVFFFLRGVGAGHAILWGIIFFVLCQFSFRVQELFYIHQDIYNNMDIRKHVLNFFPWLSLHDFIFRQCLLCSIISFFGRPSAFFITKQQIFIKVSICKFIK